VLAKIEEIRYQQTKFGASDLYKRKWRTLRDTDTMIINGDRSQQKTSFSVLQFNVLAEGLSSGPDVKTPFPSEKKNDDSGEDSLKNNYGGFSQIGHPDVCLDFSLRRWRLLEVILGLSSIEPFEKGQDTSSNHYEGMFDILAMEEMDRFRGFFAPLLRLFGYEGIFMPKTKSPGVPLGFYSDGCALFWKTTMFELVAEERFQFVVGNQVMMLATRRHRETGNSLLVAVTHLKAQKSDTNEMIRCKQVDELLKHVQEAAERTAKEDGLEKVQILIAGDFNADPPQEITSTESSVRRVLSNHERTTDDGAAKGTSKEMSLKFSSAYPVDPPPNDFYTTYKKRGKDETKRVIDYIFHSDALECIQTLAVPPAEELEGGLLPGLRYPSDHLMIAARFEVK
jgi:mRNA deadenylase 3'-5' endonuclease subunit Ccr4